MKNSSDNTSIEPQVQDKLIAKLAENSQFFFEEKYRILLQSIDEGFCTVKVLFDENDYPLDYIFLEVNAAFERQTGIKNIVGRRRREITPNPEKFWFEIYGNVALTGVPRRFEHWAAEFKCYYDVYAFRIGAPEERTIAIIFNDLSGRKQTENNLTFLAEISQDLAKLTTPDEVIELVGAKVGEYLKLSFCAFAEIDEKQNTAIITRDWHRDDLPSVSGIYHVAEFVNEEFQQTLRDGKPFIVCNTITDPRVDTERCRRLNIGAFLTVPLLREDELRFLFVVYHEYAYDWRDDEITLVSELTIRIWTKLERLYAEEEIRKSEKNLQMILESIRDYAIITFNLEGKITSFNSGAENLFGYSEQEIVGQDGAILFTPEDRNKKIPEHEIQIALKKGSAENERWHVRKDGSLFYASGMMHTLYNAKTEGFVKIARDDTQRIATEAAEREKEMLRRLIASQEEERRRIALDIHDHFGQQMTALRLKLAKIKELNREPSLREEIETIETIAANLDSDIDFIAWELRPAALDDLGLKITLGNFLREWSNHTGIKSEYHVFGIGERRFSYEIKTHFYRILQEALNNIYKHAQASKVEVIFEKRADELSLVIEDDGIGFDEDIRHKGSIGLSGIYERAKALGGAAEIESKKNSGTTIYIRVPVVFESQT